MTADVEAISRVGNAINDILVQYIEDLSCKPKQPKRTSLLEKGHESKADAGFRAIEAIRQVEDADMLRIVEALARERAINVELRAERARLKRRISEEGERLANA